MRALIIASMVVAALVCLNLQAQSENQARQGTRRDVSFIKKAAEANLAEIELGKLAAQKSQNGQVKKLAQLMQREHQDANQKLQPIAQSQGIRIRQTLDSKDQRELDGLQKLTDTGFDKEFALIALREHAQTLALFQKEVEQGQDPATKQYAQTMSSALQQHLNMAKEVAKGIGISDTTISSILGQYPGAMGGATSPSGQEQGQKKGY